MRGMQLEINTLFEELTGVGVRFASVDAYSGGVFGALEKMRVGEIQAFVGGYYDINTWSELDIEYSPLLWLETLRFYSYNNTIDEVSGKVIGAVHFSERYLGWIDTRESESVLYNSHDDLLSALKKGEIDVVFMGETGFYYNYSVLRDYGLRPIVGISAVVPLHLLYGAQNREVNALFDRLEIVFAHQPAGERAVAASRP